MKEVDGKGLFFTFEGGDGAGKTTLIEAIAHALTAKGFSVVKTREPGSTSLGEEIRALLLQRAPHPPLSPYAELCLFLASRAQHILEVIRPALHANHIVLCDRFNDSSIAYQGGARGLGPKEVAAFCAFISEGLVPHLTLYLDIDPTLALRRAKKDRAEDRIESEGTLFQEKIRDAYLAIHRQERNRFHLLDATLPPKQVYEEAMRILSPYL